MDKSDIIVLEDKSVQGFECLGLKKEMIAQQFKIALERVALLHATSMALHELEPESAERIRHILHKDYKIDDFQHAFDDMERGYLKGLGKY